MSSEENKISNEEIVQIARLALAGRPQDVQTFLRRLARRHRAELPGLAAQLTQLLQEAPTRQSPLRREATAPVPVDLESRLQLLRVEEQPTLDVEPIWDASVKRALHQILSERQRDEALLKQGLVPTRSIIFTGPPGVGKTFAARWIARELNRPLLTLDLSAVMSSFLGGRVPMSATFWTMRKVLTASCCWTSSTRSRSVGMMRRMSAS